MASALTDNNKKKQRSVRERINDFAHFSTHNKKRKKFYIKLWRKFGIYRVKSESDDDDYGYGVKAPESLPLNVEEEKLIWIFFHSFYERK